MLLVTTSLGNLAQQALRGRMTVNQICNILDDHFLSKQQQQQRRWLQFLQIWKAAGWECPDLVLLAKESRPLQYGHPQDKAQVTTTWDKADAVCINLYGHIQGHRSFKLKESLKQLPL